MGSGLAVLLLYLTATALRKDEPASLERRHQPGYLGSAKEAHAFRPNLPSSVPFTYNSKRIPNGKGSAHHESSIPSVPPLPAPHAIPYITAPARGPHIFECQAQHWVSSERTRLRRGEGGMTIWDAKLYHPCQGARALVSILPPRSRSRKNTRSGASRPRQIGPAASD